MARCRSMVAEPAFAARQSRKYCYASHHLVIDPHGDARVRGYEDVHPRTELHHPVPVAGLHCVALFNAAHDAARKYADDLPHDDWLAIMVDRDLGVLIE